MPWAGGGKGSKGSKGKSSKKEEAKEKPEYLKAVDGRWHITKASLRAYASMSGSPFYASLSQTDSDFLNLKNIIEKEAPYTTEIMNRMGIALSEAGGTIGMGKDLLLKYAAEPASTGEKLGVQGVLELLQSDAGKAFVAAAATFNKHEDNSKAAAALQTAATA